MNFAIIGASGNVGRKTIEILEKSKISFKDLYLVASKKSAGRKIIFREKEIEIENLENYDFSKAQITIFAAGSDIAKEWAPKAANKTIVIDNSSFFRMQKNIVSKNFTKQIAFNLIPHIDVFDKDGYTKEELKMTNETKKILDDKIEVTATCVRVPVRTGHSESINIEFEKNYDLENIIKILDNAAGCKVVDGRKDGEYITPLEAENDYTTYISRIRKDNTNPKAINIWVVSDNLLKGAALNTVQIAECLMKKL